MRFGLIYGLVLLGASFLAPVAEAQDPSEQMSQFVDWDVNHNAERGVKVETHTRPVEYFEIPLNDAKLTPHDNYMQWIRNEKGKHNAIIIDVAEYLPKEVRDVLFVEKYGVEHVRYFVSPTDQSFAPRVQEYLNNRGILHRYYTADGEHKSEFFVKPTASRSMIIIDPRNGYSFSLKPSTDKSTARHSNDPNPTHWAFLNRRLSDYYWKMRGALRHLDVAWEAATVGFPNMEYDGNKFAMQSQSVRLMDEVARGKRMEMSGFVLVDSTQEIERIAKEAGMDPQKFRMRAQEIKGQGMAEMAAVLGWTFTSNHSQNFRWVLRPDYSLAGSIRVLDLTDGHPNRAIFELHRQEQLLADWEFLTKSESSWNTIKTGRNVDIRSFWRDSTVSAEELAAYESGLKERLEELVRNYELTGSGKDRVLVLPENLAEDLVYREQCLDLGLIFGG